MISIPSLRSKLAGTGVGTELTGTGLTGTGVGTGIPVFRLLAFLFFSLILVSVVSADCSVTSLTTSAASAAQVGDSVVVTVTYSGSSCSGSQLYLDASSGLEADPAYRTLSSDSGSSTFSITASVAGTYSYNARLSTSESTEASIEFVSPDVLTVTDDSEPETVTGQALSDAFDVSIVISNPSAANITSSYSFTYDSSLMSRSGGASSGSVTVRAGDTTTITRSFTPTNYFTDEEIIFNLGSNYGAFTTTASTVSASSGDEDTSGTSTSGTNRTTIVTTTGTNATTTTSTTSTTSQNGTGSTTGQTGTTTGTSNVTWYDAQNSIDSVSMAISQALVDGKDVTVAQDKYNEARAAYTAGNYAKAKELADEALSLVKLATKPATKPSSGTASTGTTTPPPSAETGGAKKTDLGILLIGGVVAVVALVGLVVAYFLIKRGKGNSGGNDDQKSSYKGRRS